MNVTRNVIEDLLPAYLCGEATADTKALVEDFLRQNPQFAMEVEQQKRNLVFGSPAQSAALRPSANLEAATLMRTRAMLRRRSWLLASSILFTTLPLAFVYGDGHVVWMMLRDTPRQAVSFWFLAGGCWIGLWMTQHKLRVTGI